MTFEEFMRGYEEYKQQGGAGGNSGAAVQNGYGIPAPAGTQSGQGISYEDFIEGFYQLHPERRPQQAPAAPAGTRPLGEGSMPAAQGAAGNVPAGQSAQETPEAAYNRQLYNGLLQNHGTARGGTPGNSSAVQPGVTSQSSAGSTTARDAWNRALQLTANSAPVQGASESGWTVQQALAAAQQVRQAAEQTPVVRAAQQTGGRGLNGLWLNEQARAEFEQRAWQEDPGRFAITEMLPTYFGNGLTDGVRSAANGAAGIMSAMLKVREVGTPFVTGLLDPNGTWQMAERMQEQTDRMRQAVNDFVMGNAGKSEQNAEKLAERFAGMDGTAANMARWIGGGAGSMAPQIAAGALGGPAVSGALIFGQGMGDYYADALADGATTDQALAAGLIGGAANYGIEKAFGGIPLVGEGVVPVDDIIDRYVRSRTGRIILNRLAEAMGEGVEEVAENYLKPAVQRLTYGKEIEWPTLQENLDSFTGGFFASLATGTLMEDLPQQQRAEWHGRTVRAAEGGEARLLDEARRYAEAGYKPSEEGGIAARRAQEVLKTLDRGENVSDARLGELAAEIGRAREAGAVPSTEVEPRRYDDLLFPMDAPAGGDAGGPNISEKGQVEMAALAGAGAARTEANGPVEGTSEGPAGQTGTTAEGPAAAWLRSRAAREAALKSGAADAGRFAEFERAVLRFAESDAVLKEYADKVRQTYTAQDSPALQSLLGADGQVDAAALNEEVALKLAEQLVYDPERMADAVTRERGLGEVLLDFIRGIKNSIAIQLTGSQKAMLDEAERRLVNLLRGGTGSVEGQRFSVQQDADGHAYVQVDTDQDIFEGKTLREKIKIAREYMKQHFQGKVLDVGDSNAFVNRRSIEEYLHPANYRIDPELRSTKVHAGTELDNLLSVSTFLRHNQDDGRHEGATGGWDTYRTEFEIAGERFTGEIKVMNTDRGRRFYDISQIEKSPVSAASQRLALDAATSDLSAEPSAHTIYPREARAPHQTIPQGYNSLNNNISQDGGDVNKEKNSLAVPYRTPENKTLWEYMLEAYYDKKMAGKEGNGTFAPPAADTQGELPPAASPAEEWGRMAAQNYGKPAQPKIDSSGWVNGIIDRPAENGNARMEGEAGQQAETAPAGQATQGGAKAENGPALKASAKSLEIQKRATRSFVDKAAGALSVPKWASREFLRPIAERLSETFKTEGKIDKALADKMFETAYEQGIIQDTEMVDQYGDLRKEIRGTALRLDRETLDSKSYNELRRKYFGILQLSKDGVPIDSYYMELCEAYPELFDSEITHPADQAERIYEVCKSIEVTSRDLDAYYGDDAENFKRFARDGFDQALEELTGGLYKVRRLEIDNARPKTSAAGAETLTLGQISQIYQDAARLEKKAEQAMSRAALTEGDKKIVEQLLVGNTSEEFLRYKGQENLDDILSVYKARKAAQDAKRPIQQQNAQIRAERAERAMQALEGTEGWKDKPAGWRYALETQERNIRDISGGDEAGRQMVEQYFAPVHVHEAAATRMKNEYRARIEPFKLNRWESAYAQIWGEQQGLAEADRRGLTRQEGEAEQLAHAMQELMEEHDREIDTAKAQKAAGEIRRALDELIELKNEALVANGYEPIRYRQGYFPHFREGKADTMIENMAALIGLSKSPDDLPTNIAGLTEGFKPGRRWDQNAKERTGYHTEYNALKGFDLYLEVAADVIHHTDDIRNLRALAEAIRYKYGEEGVKEEIRKIRADDSLTELARDEKLTQIREIGSSHMSNFVQNLDEYTSLLAGKKSKMDRGAEQFLGRGFYRSMGNIYSRIAANMVAVNPGSWLTNFLPAAQVAAEAGAGNTLRAARDMVMNVWHDDGFADRSDFLTNRAGSTMLSRTNMQKLSGVLSSPMELIDGIASNLVTRSYYYMNRQRGMGEVEAIQAADRQAAGLMADRSKGAQPTIFESKNPFIRTLTMFQVEVNNEFRHLAKDIPDLAKEMGKGWSAALMMAVGHFVYAYLYNDLYELFTGRRCALDPLDLFNQAFGGYAGRALPNTFTEARKVLKGTASWEEDTRTEQKGIAETTASIAAEAAQQLPFVGGLLGGGRVPVSAALPDIGSISSSIGGYLDGDKSGVQAAAGVGRELAKPLWYLGPPIGGGQIKKTLEGLGTMARGGYYTQGKEGEQLQTAVDQSDPASWILAGLFGRGSIPEMRNYYAGSRRGLTAEQTATIKELGMTPQEGIEWYTTFGGRGDNEKRSNFYQVRFGEEAVDLDRRLAQMKEDGVISVLPSTPDRTLTVNGEKVELDAKTFKEYTETRANGSYELLSYLPQLEAAGADAELQAAYVKRVQEYMAEVAKEQAVSAEPKDWVTDVRAYAGMSGGQVDDTLANVLLGLVIVSLAKPDKWENGNSVKGSRQRNAIAALEEIGFDRATALEFWELFG